MKMKWIQKLRQIDIGISVIALVLLIAVTFAGVIFRYVFSKPFSWQEEVQLALIIWVIFWIIKVVEGLPKLLRVFREGLA